MPYHKKRFLSYTIVILCFLTAYTCRLIHTNNSLIQALVDQSRTSIYLGMYCAWVIYLNKHVVYKRMRQCLTVIGCLMVFWFFLRTVKYHIFQDPLSTHICWYLYYFPMILIPTLGLNASFLLEEDFHRYYYSGNFPKLTEELRECVIANSSIQENGVLIKHIPVKGGHLFWTEDISVLLDQYQDIEEQQEELTERNQLLQMTYQKEAARKKLEEQNRLLNMIQDQTYKQYELLSSYMKKLEQTESREEYDMLLSKIVVVGTYLKRRKNLVLTRYSSQGDSLTMADLKQSLAESCENLKLCRIRAAYYVQDKEKQLQADDILNCYDFFEWLIEQLFDVINSVFFRVTQIDEKLQISVHVMSSTDIHNFLKERPELLIQQEEEQEWFIRCPLS